MAVYGNSGRLGVPPLSDVHTTAQVPLGTIVSGYDSVTNTEGEYFYGKANAAITVGQICYLNNTNEVLLADADTHVNDGGPVGFALTTFAENDFGWFQISGKVKAKAGTVAAGGKVMLTSTGGTVDDAAVTGGQVLGAEFDTNDGTPAAGFAYVTCNRPHVQGQIT